MQEVTINPPSPEILKAAKARVLNSFVFNFSSSEAQLQRLLGYSIVGLPQVQFLSHDLLTDCRTADVIFHAL